ncbi:tetratricopeptide repeat protein [Roseiarcaceae bacterium H3SJ34-1]|uniref:tetratricopeptide repeat protein n=1 Tax=Terripilifer ovatus TaxID=3032367 RepID=UPI003AB94680|nr:tetratricopeptide repeat protein [Roseiarcaceae bacterium H3SJ34-1]
MNATVGPFEATQMTTPANLDLESRCEHTLELLLTHRGNPSAEVERVLADDPQYVPGHCLRAALIVRADKASGRSRLADSLAAIEAACPDVRDRMHRHAAAARAWLDGDPALAAERYGAIVGDWPSDLLALAVAHALDFHLGQRRIMRDRIARVLPAWTAAMPGYASVLAMYAFSLEENGEYDLAEQMAKRALALDARHAGAIHVVAHVMEMQGRVSEGLAFLSAYESAWQDGTDLSIHLAWHRALFQLDANDAKPALATYDARISVARPSDMTALADASALLWRLKLRNIDVSVRWRQLADRWEKLALTGARPFYIVHAMMAFAATSRTEPAAQALGALQRIDTADPSPPLTEDALALPFCEALLAFASGDYRSCIVSLTRVRHIANQCGGSVAQCDVVHLTFTEAAIRAGALRLAEALVAERVAERPASRLNRLLRRRLRVESQHRAAA